jgi:glycosyltransferase involved in cell wall biosynthesis
MRVAIVTENFLPKLDGVTRTIAMLLEHLQLRGHQAIVFGPEGSVRRYAGAHVVPVPGIPIPFYPELRFLFPRRALGRKLARFHPDIVHLADPMLLGMAGLYWAQRIAVPVVAAYHTNLADYVGRYGLRLLEGPTWSYRRFLHNQCAATLCPSPSTAQMLRDRQFERVHIWSRGVDSQLFTPARRSESRRRELGVDDEQTTLLLFVGRLSHEKNIMMLPDAYRAVAGPHVRLAIVGDGPARAELERSMRGLPVTFTGYLTGEALADTYASADLFTFPSTTETFGQVVQEAMASGLPVVGAQAEGVCDIVQPGVTGLLARPNDTQDFTAAVQALVADSARRIAMSHAAREWAETRSWTEVMDGLLSLYQEIIASPSIPRDPDSLPDSLEDLIPA